MKHAKKVIIFAIILFILVESLTLVFLPKVNLKKYKLHELSSYEILGEKDNTIDAIFLGDSLVYSSVSPMRIWGDYGITTFDCGAAAELTSSSYKHLQAALRSQTPKIVFLEANVLFRDPAKSSWRRTAVREYDSFLSIAKFHNNWKKYLLEGKKEDWLNIYKGYKYITKTKKSKLDNDYMKPTKNASNIPEINIEYFKKIKELCDNNNIELILISTPSQNSWNYSKRLGTLELIEKYNIEFIDLNYNNPLDINWSKETKDRGDHLNYKGAKKVSEYLGNYLKEKGLKDHREEEYYNIWNKAYKKYEEALIK